MYGHVIQLRNVQVLASNASASAPLPRFRRISRPPGFRRPNALIRKTAWAAMRGVREDGSLSKASPAKASPALRAGSVPVGRPRSSARVHLLA
jgi:hypothetical protein